MAGLFVLPLPLPLVLPLVLSLHLPLPLRPHPAAQSARGSSGVYVAENGANHVPGIRDDGQSARAEALCQICLYPGWIPVFV